MLSASTDAVAARLTAATREEMGQGIWLIRLEAAKPGRRVVFSDPSDKSVAFDVSSSSGTLLDFARGSVPFLPREVSFTGNLRSLRVSHVPADAPIPADPGAILTWDRSAWRTPDFELFSWTRFPQVLILDMATYEIQDALLQEAGVLRRKGGPRGQAGIGGRPGIAARLQRPRLPGGGSRAVLHAGQAGLCPSRRTSLKGSCWTTASSRSRTAGSHRARAASFPSRAALPRSFASLLLTHESFHGIYFSLPAFRDATEKEWASLSPVEQDVWMEYLSHNNYDTTDHYLVVNEFQSYLMQQARAGVMGFQDITLSRMRSWSAHAAALARQLAATHPTSFLKSFDVLDGALQQAGGAPRGAVLRGHGGGSVGLGRGNFAAGERFLLPSASCSCYTSIPSRQVSKGGGLWRFNGASPDPGKALMQVYLSSLARRRSAIPTARPYSTRRMSSFPRTGRRSPPTSSRRSTSASEG